jgi:Nucleotidyl transferase AbiEii toxin, Type IV TA system
MAGTYLHNHRNFPDLLRILEEETGIQAYLIEKDYWIMHVLYGLQRQQFSFELKGGTSLSKAFKIIHRFSEDVDIQIHAPAEFRINENPKNTNANNVKARKEFYDWLAGNIQIDGIIRIQRDEAFDDKDYYRSGGIRLYYTSYATPVKGVKEGILLEAGFDTTSPNQPVTISSWTFDKATATQGIEILDNRAIDVVCYYPEYTFVEKLQTIATKYRKEQSGEEDHPNFMRQYYDVYCLLREERIQGFMGTPEYRAHKQKRFPAADREIPVAENQAYLLDNPTIHASYKKRYEDTAGLYYKGQPAFEELLARLKQNLNRL